MPSRMIHYLIAEKVAVQVKIKDLNRFKIGSLCPDMSLHTDDSKHQTHYIEIHGDKKGGNWLRFAKEYKEQMKQDDLYLGILCHLITDMIWFHEVMEPSIRSKVKSKEERQEKYQYGYSDFHRLNYILREEFEKAGLADKIWQFFTVVPDFRSTGVREGKRVFDWPVIIRAVNTVDAMSAEVPEIDWNILKKITDRILAEVPGVCRVLYDLSPKAPATIEWE